MDTDNLSKEAYNAVIIEAEKFRHDLTLQFGLLSYSCANEDEFLKESKQLITHIKRLKGHQLLDIFYGVVPDEKKLLETLSTMELNISKVEKIPEQMRQYEF